MEVAERGQRKSRFSKFASTIAFRGARVDKHLADGFEKGLVTRGLIWIPRGAAWSNMKPGRGLGLKKQILSDCDLRNLSSVGDGAGT